jgi:hypothetical protein
MNQLKGGENMGLGKALARLGLKAGSNQITKTQVKGASSKAYKQTGKQMAQARKEGRWVNGSALHKQNKRKKIGKAYHAGRTRSNFIDDLFS